ncbi:MAG: ABC transporter permease [Deltaproteobacteria bacterium]|nr:ABC transporter permease [Deltaproteobacteria bacterium]
MLANAMRQAVRLLWAHKTRALLTMFGLVWGTASVIFLVSWGHGVTAMLETGFFRAGKNMGEVWAGKSSEQFSPAVDRRYLWFTLDDVVRLRNRARLPEVIGAETWEMLPITFRQRAHTVDIRGIDPETLEIRGVRLAAGRGITRADLEHRRRVVVLGHRIRSRLLAGEGQIDSWVRIAGKPFRVVGLLERVGTQLSRDRMEIDEQAWIPITTLQTGWPSWWTDDEVVTKILYRMRDRSLLEETEAEVRAILAEGLGVSADDEEAVGIWSAIEMLNRIPLDELSGFLFILAAATLLIGGVGILNMMLDSVHERRHEIGLRLAIGARRNDVVMQFFLETFAIIVIGGLVGVAFGVLACLALAQVQVDDLIPVPVFQLDIVFVTLAILGFVGMAAGVIPAWRAARVDPASMLRME